MNKTALDNWLRIILYYATAIVGALGAGFTAIGRDVPDVLVFFAAVVASLAGVFAVKNFTIKDSEG